MLIMQEKERERTRSIPFIKISITLFDVSCQSHSICAWVRVERVTRHETDREKRKIGSTQMNRATACSPTITHCYAHYFLSLSSHFLWVFFAVIDALALKDKNWISGWIVSRLCTSIDIIMVAFTCVVVFFTFIWCLSAQVDTISVWFIILSQEFHFN